MLKASEDLEAYRFLLWSYEPTSTVSKLVNLLATSLGGNLIDALMGLSAMGTEINSSQETVHGVESMDTWRDTVERKPNICKTTKQVDGLGRMTKAKAKSRAKARTTK